MAENKLQEMLDSMSGTSKVYSEWSIRNYAMDSIKKLSIVEHRKLSLANSGLETVLETYNKLVKEENQVNIYQYYLNKYMCAREKVKNRIERDKHILEEYDDKLFMLKMKYEKDNQTRK